MAEPLVVYLSAAADLRMEREAIGRALAELPCDVEIRLYVSHEGNGLVDTAALLRADVHILMLGGDIRAPVGLEWQLARQAGRSPVALLHGRRLRTLSAREFVRMVSALHGWQTFEDVHALRLTVLDRLADAVLADPIRFGVSAGEIAGLQEWRRELSERRPDDALPMGEGAGAGRVLLSRRGIATSGGVIVEEHNET